MPVAYPVPCKSIVAVECKIAYSQYMRLDENGKDADEAQP